MEDAAQAVVDQAYAAFNSGDVERWVEMREPGSFFATEEDRAESAAWMSEVAEEQVASGAQFTDIECTSHGEGEWPDVADPGVPTPIGIYITCATILTPETVRGAGRVAFEWVIADDAVVAVMSTP
jgi:hypothetical protein